MVSLLILLLCIITLIALSAFFSGSETSMLSLNRYRLRHLSKSGHRAAKRALKMLKRPDRLLGTILIGNTFANILASALATVLAGRLFGDVGVAIATVILTFMVLIFAEVLPKTIAAVKPQGFAFGASLPLQIVLTVIYPIVWLINNLVAGLLKIFGLKLPTHLNDALTLEEISSVIRASKGSLTKRYENMLMGVLDLQNATIEDVMVPHNHIVGIDLNDQWEDILQQLSNSPFSRLPLYRDNIDNIVGILHLKDFTYLLKQPLMDLAQLEKLVKPPYFIPESTNLLHQLANFQKNGENIAMVVDEYGAIQGLATAEDILEEVVGEFTSKDQPAANDTTEQKPDGSYIVEGLMTIRDINRDLGYQLPTKGPKTLSGLITEYLEALPMANSCVLINGYPIEIISVDDNAVKQARLYPKQTSLKG